MASIHWDKFSRKIKIELSKIRDDRVVCNNFMETCQHEFDRLIETSPNIPTDIIRWFRKLIKRGNQEDNIGGCQLCIYEYCCFPFGIECCNNYLPCCCWLKCLPCYKPKNETNTNEFIGIEMPEIIGNIKPTVINTSSNNNCDNEYEIYNSSNV